jgi:hypothetical protein
LYCYGGFRLFDEGIKCDTSNEKVWKWVKDDHEEKGKKVSHQLGVLKGDEDLKLTFSQAVYFERRENVKKC